MSRATRPEGAANVHETQARTRKAYRLARVLVSNGATDARSVFALGSHYRKMAEEEAGVRAASSTTWAMASALVEMIAEEDANRVTLGPVERQGSRWGHEQTST